MSAIVSFPLDRGIEEKTYAQANYAYVLDGHLYLATWPVDGDTVAIFAPGDWKSVEVNRV